MKSIQVPSCMKTVWSTNSPTPYSGVELVQLGQQGEEDTVPQTRALNCESTVEHQTKQDIHCWCSSVIEPFILPSPEYTTPTPWLEATSRESDSLPPGHSDKIQNIKKNGSTLSSQYFLPLLRLFEVKR